MTDNVDFGSLITRIIGERSIREVAKQVGVSHTSVYEMKNGKVPGFRVVARFADALGVSQVDREALSQAASYNVAPVVPSSSPAKDSEITHLVAALSETAQKLSSKQILALLAVATA